MSGINKLTDKYLVLKVEDIESRITRYGQKELEDLVDDINLDRKQDGKLPQKYAVLNLDDEIDLRELIDIFKLKQMRVDEAAWGGPHKKIKVKDIAVDLINAILK